MRLAPVSDLVNSGMTSRPVLLATSKKNFLLSVYSLKGLLVLLIQYVTIGNDAMFISSPTNHS